jgi:transposase-like protein
MGRHGYPTEFRRRALDLVASGRKVCDVAKDLGISDQTVYNWRRQDKIDKGIESGVTTEESTKLRAAKKKIAALETELAIHRRASELLKERHDPKVGTRPSV